MKAAECLKVQPGECIVFEDAVAGIESAKRAGMKVIGVGDPSILIDADAVIQNFEGLDLHFICTL